METQYTYNGILIEIHGSPLEILSVLAMVKIFYRVAQAVLQTPYRDPIEFRTYWKSWTSDRNSKN